MIKSLLLLSVCMVFAAFANDDTLSASIQRAIAPFYVHQKREPALAAVCACVVPGGGSLYNREPNWPLWFFLGGIAPIGLGIAASNVDASNFETSPRPILWGLSVSLALGIRWIDAILAVRSAQRFNDNLDTQLRENL